MQKHFQYDILFISWSAKSVFETHTREDYTVDTFSGVYKATKKDTTEYYRASITHRNKHISLGSFITPADAERAYHEAEDILRGQSGAYVDTVRYTTGYEPSTASLSFDKWVTLVNLRDNGIYIKTPVYLCRKFFVYFLSPEKHMIFSADDLFYYSTHKIMARNGYLFVNDFGTQTNILSRYSIKNHAVCGRDYYFVNGDPNDYRYNNIEITNPYSGVRKIFRNGRNMYKVKIHINGDFVVGIYMTEKEAAIAYNKAADILRSKGFVKNFPSNYIDNINPIEYASLYNAVKISKRIRNL